MEVKDIIDNVSKGDNVNATKAFNNIIDGKLKDALQAKKVEVASKLVQKYDTQEEE